MAVPQELEIQEWQRKPGLNNPLTKEQVEWAAAETARQFVGVYSPQPNRIQELAKDVLQQGASLPQVLELIMDDF